MRKQVCLCFLCNELISWQEAEDRGVLSLYLSISRAYTAVPSKGFIGWVELPLHLGLGKVKIRQAMAPSPGQLGQ